MLLLLGVPAVRPACGQTRNHLAIAQEVLRATFPELSGEVSVVVDSKIDGDWSRANPVRLTVHRFDPRARDHSRDILAAIVQIRTDGTIQEATFYGDYLKSELDGVYEFVRASKAATEANILAELRQREVKYLPPDDSGLVKALNLSRLNQSIGVARQTSAEFVALPANESVRKDFSPFWIVRMSTAMPSGQTACYSLTVDPLSLRIRRINRRECDAP
jgi:hypothetical protein